MSTVHWEEEEGFPQMDFADKESVSLFDPETEELEDTIDRYELYGDLEYSWPRSTTARPTPHTTIPVGRPRILLPTCREVYIDLADLVWSLGLLNSALRRSPQSSVRIQRSRTAVQTAVEKIMRRLKARWYLARRCTVRDLRWLAQRVAGLPWPRVQRALILRRHLLNAIRQAAQTAP